MTHRTQIEQYTQGQCHVFAIAAQIQHGGSFLVAWDTNEVHWFDEDGEPEIYKVLHVFARLNAPDGSLVIRDIHGDRPEDMTAIRDELAIRYGLWADDISLEEVTPLELQTLISDEFGTIAEDLKVEHPLDGIDHDDRPLENYGPSDLLEAHWLDEVKAVPGTRPITALAPYEDEQQAVM